MSNGVQQGGEPGASNGVASAPATAMSVGATPEPAAPAAATVATGAPAVATPAPGRPDGTALRWLWLSVGVIVVDQVTKAVIVATFRLFERVDVLPVLEITRLHNTGAAFSMLHDAGGWQHYFFVGLALLVSAGIAWWLGKLRFRANAMLASGLALILGGALGNVIDRLVHGHVVDFIHFHWGQQWYFPAFNVADTAITIGAGLLILDSLLESRRTAGARGTT